MSLQSLAVLWPVVQLAFREGTGWEAHVSHRSSCQAGKELRGESQAAGCRALPPLDAGVWDRFSPGVQKVHAPQP